MSAADQSLAEARAVFDAHLLALNFHDETALAQTLHFPHYRLSEGVVKVWETPETYFEDFKARAGSRWGHTEWGAITPVQAGADKVHFTVEVLRFDAQRAEIARFAALWVVAKIDGKWAAQMRSSFADDAVYGSD
ncbi:MAG: hypothetical protein AAGA63_04035 [Pseudomonadota bacterium]